MNDDLNRSIEARLGLLENAGIAALLADKGQSTADDQTWTAGQVKAFIEALLNEKDRALEMADDEREKAASALRGEQQRALDQAGRERDKAAENLRIELARSIKEGDDRLREHISNQIVQIQSALDSAERLETERLSGADALTQALSEKLEVLRMAQTSAQDKFERSVESRFMQVNEFRAALDDLSKQMATRRELESALATTTERDEARSKEIADLRSRLDIGPLGLSSLQSRVDQRQGQVEGSRLTVASFGTIAALAVALISTAIAIATQVR